MHASVTIPALFSVPSTFTIGHGLGRVFLGNPHHSAVRTSMKFSVAPLSISVLAVALSRVRSKFTLMFREFLWLTYTRSRDMARTQATQVEPSKKTKTVDRSKSTRLAAEFFPLRSSPRFLLVRLSYLESRLPRWR